MWGFSQPQILDDPKPCALGSLSPHTALVQLLSVGSLVIAGFVVYMVHILEERKNTEIWRGGEASHEWSAGEK